MQPEEYIPVMDHSYTGNIVRIRRTQKRACIGNIETSRKIFPDRDP